ncbi:TPA: hypothetical protein LU109_003620 [Enterobacter hormaechei subsp. xiangfangensis]|nr:hypothetical protein [Enterobacter hormaechei subsp. xiangfangensis]
MGKYLHAIRLWWYHRNQARRLNHLNGNRHAELVAKLMETKWARRHEWSDIRVVYLNGNVPVKLFDLPEGEQMGMTLPDLETVVYYTILEWARNVPLNARIIVCDAQEEDLAIHLFDVSGGFLWASFGLQAVAEYPNLND